MAVRGSYFPFKNTDQVQDRHVHRCRARRRGVGGGGACSSSGTPCLVTPARARCCAAEVSGQRLPLRIVEEESSHVKVFHEKVRVKETGGSMRTPDVRLDRGPAAGGYVGPGPERCWRAGERGRMR